MKTQLEVRQKMYENILDEAVFISRASEGALSTDWIMEQPVFIRKKFLKSFSKELEERKKLLASNKSKHKKR